MTTGRNVGLGGCAWRLNVVWPLASKPKRASIDPAR